MTNVTGIYITIKAWLPTGKGLDEQFTALSLVKTAHETGDYAPLLSAAKIEAVQTEQKTRRMDDPAGVVVATGEPLQTDADIERHLATPAAEDTAIAQAPVMDQPDGKDEQPVAKPKLARSQQGLEASKARNAAEDAGV